MTDTKHSDSSPPATYNRPDEWKIEQGLSAGKLPYLDQTGPETVEIPPREYTESQIEKDEEAVKASDKHDEWFQRERPGWKGYGHCMSCVMPLMCSQLHRVGGIS